MSTVQYLQNHNHVLVVSYRTDTYCTVHYYIQNLRVNYIFMYYTWNVIFNKWFNLGELLELVKNQQFLKLINNYCTIHVLYIYKASTEA